MRLIDRDEALLLFGIIDDGSCDECPQRDKSDCGNELFSRNHICEVFDCIKDVDAVPVVRCKDCKYAHMTIKGEVKYCDVWFPHEAAYVDGDYYCADGERKDEEENGNESQT